MADRIYISSTYLDLRDFRRAIMDCVQSIDADRKYYTFTSMEFYDAEDVHFVKKCLDDVSNCDIYILILGNRYGYIPNGMDRSITELEYEKALACKQGGTLKEILVFKVGNLCNTYTYQENDPKFGAYQQEFLNEVNEKTGPLPFDSAAELSLQVSYSLMKRLFRLIKNDPKLIAPDRSEILCYCDRTPQINKLKSSILFQNKRLFFLHGNRTSDFPAGIVKRFVRYTLGVGNRIEPLNKIADMFSNDDDQNYVEALLVIFEYLNIVPTPDNLTVEGLLKELKSQKGPRITLPFYFDFDSDFEQDKLLQFIRFAHTIFKEYEKSEYQYQLYLIIVIYSSAEGQDPIKTFLETSLENAELKKLTEVIDRLKPVAYGDVIDWLEKFITSIELSSSLYKEYFQENNPAYTMQYVNVKLSEILKDLSEGNDRITKFF